MTDELRRQFQDAAPSVDAAPVPDILERAARLRRRRVRQGVVGGGLTLAFALIVLAVYVVGSHRPGVTVVAGSPGPAGSVSPSARCVPSVLYAAPGPEMLTATVVPAGFSCCRSRGYWGRQMPCCIRRGV